MTTRHNHWINGKDEAPAGGAYLSTLIPATRQSGDEIARGNAEDVERAVDAAAQAWRGWARRTSAERGDVLHAVANAIAAHYDEFVELERAATGKTDAQLKFEIDTSIAYFRYYAGVVRTFGGRTIDAGGSTHTYTRLEPYGVVAIITPWNLPLNQSARAVAPALAVGNAVILKPSEFTSITSVLLGRLASEAGLPDGVLSVVTGTGPEVGAPLVEHPAVRRIAFTGSVATGKHLATVAANRLVPATLELGGKSPVIVFADADMDRAVAAAVTGIQANSGQICSATTRLLVEASVHDEVVARVVERVRALQPGPDFGPIITQAQYEKVLDYFDWASGEGITPAIGGAAYADGPGAAGLFVQPTVYAGVAPDGKLAQEEIFGPVLVTIPFTDEDDAVRIANNTEYGLVGSVWTRDVARGIRIAEQVDAGQIGVNGGALTVETPFGGYKNSGYGREKGVEAMHDYAQVKSVSISLT
ncbi:MAG TPA: aldehyde dehydrogenase family protein [Jatrophihabitans sp.]|jgi:aldehyde dehydrogenase (NAD+)